MKGGAQAAQPLPSACQSTDSEAEYARQKAATGVKHGKISPARPRFRNAMMDPMRKQRAIRPAPVTPNQYRYQSENRSDGVEVIPRPASVNRPIRKPVAATSQLNAILSLVAFKQGTGL